jgi:hypothetical protein
MSTPRVAEVMHSGTRPCAASPAVLALVMACQTPRGLPAADAGAQGPFATPIAVEASPGESAPQAYVLPKIEVPVASCDGGTKAGCPCTAPGKGSCDGRYKPVVCQPGDLGLVWHPNGSSGCCDPKTGRDVKERVPAVGVATNCAR